MSACAYPRVMSRPPPMVAISCDSGRTGASANAAWCISRPVGVRRYAMLKTSGIDRAADRAEAEIMVQHRAAGVAVVAEFTGALGTGGVENKQHKHQNRNRKKSQKKTDRRI